MAIDPAAYIAHHLHHWQWSLTGDTSSFWTVNLDTLLISITCGFVFLGVFYRSIQKASLHHPGRCQVAIEAIVSMVDKEVEGVLHKRDSATVSVALSIFMWIWLMNFMDLIPVDLIPFLASFVGVNSFRPVPTADLNLTAALAFSVLLISMYEGIRSHSLPRYLWDYAAHPFSIFLFPVNILFRIIEDCSKPIALSLRLFGNMMLGELVFFLIALTPLHIQWLLGWFWLGLHLFVITIQAFIFMVLSIVYIGLAKSSH